MMPQDALLCAAAAALAGTLACALVPACSADHSLLARRDGGPAAGGAGMGGAAAGGAGAAGSGAESGGGTAAVGGSGGGGEYPEPPGPTRLTLVNGVVDTTAIRLCFAPYPPGSGPSLDPWPDLPGLAFGAGRALGEMGDALPADADVEIYALAGDLGATQGKGCEELVAAPGADAGPVWRAVSAGVLPQAVLASNKSVLVALDGCAGGEDHTSPGEQQICGEGYAPGTPNLGLVAGAMSRITLPDAVAFQFVQASRATAAVDLRLVPGYEGALHISILYEWTWGEIAPYPPYLSFSVAELGAFGTALLEVFPPGQISPLAAVPVAEALARGDLGPADIADGRGLVFVAVGAAPGVGPGPWWHPLTFAIVRSDP
ncbi:MAG: hypothetical protein HY744_19175 [Deltaproteobacteria bacterium]|nr:hypothetical protein [Deltaproteobacteria bacterium]